MNDDTSLARIESALADAGAERRPPDAWQDRVLAAATASPRTPWLRWWLAAPALAMAAVLLWIAPWAVDPAPLQLTMHTVHRGEAHRASSASRGDVLTATARSGRERAIWVFLDEQLVASCPGSGAICRPSGDGIELELGLERGRYEVVAVDAAHRLSPLATYDRALDAAEAAGAQLKIESLRVD